METPVSEPRRDEGPWGAYLVIIILIAVSIAVLNLVDQIHSGNERGMNSSQGQALRTGDMYARQALLGIPGYDPRTNALTAISFYQTAGNYPEVLRRTGIIKQSILRISGAEDFSVLGSLKDGGKSEAGMWMRIYGSKSLPKDVAQSYIERIGGLDLGPLQKVALADVYSREGEPAKARSLLNDAQRSAIVYSALLLLVVVALFVAAAAGIWIGFSYLRNTNYFGYTSTSYTQPAALLAPFLTYLLSYQILQIGIISLLGLFNIDTYSESGSVIGLLLQMVCMFAAVCLGILGLIGRLKPLGQDIRGIGLRFDEPGRKIAAGFGAYCAVLPLLGISIYLTQWIFRNVNTPEHPIVEIAGNGGWALALSIIVAAIAAPIVEEISFRGFLYTGLRDKLGAWGAALLSGAIFSMLHPTFPGQFIPLFVLGVVLCLVRERTGSLLSSMVCHALNNFTALMLIVLLS